MNRTERAKSARVVQVMLKRPEISETFLLANAAHLPAQVTVVHGVIPIVGDEPVLSDSILSRAWRRADRLLKRKGWNWEITRAYATVFRRTQAQVVLAEYGDTGVAVLDACLLTQVPLVVSFHGFDASRKQFLAAHAEGYRRLFKHAAALVVVSRSMGQALVELGAPAERVHYRPSGADCRKFGGADPERAGPVFLAVGRLVAKKAPHLTLLAFADLHRRRPDARLRIIGDGPLRSVCEDLRSALGLQHAVEFLGAQPHARVQQEMQAARAFVQHSVQAADGDSEGTPVAVMEAGAAGLPVISTHHAGIPEVVIDGETGLLTAERDVAGMAKAMSVLLDAPDVAGRMGRAGQTRIREHFSLERTSAQLWTILEGVISGHSRSTFSPEPTELKVDRGR